MMWALFALLALSAMAVVGLGAVRRSRRGLAGEADEVALNKALYREKIEDLERQCRAGEIDEAQFEELRLEFQRQLLGDSEAPAEDTPPEERGPLTRGRAALAVSAALVPLLALAIYAGLGASDELTVTRQLEERAALLMTPDTDQERLATVTRRLEQTLRDQVRDNPERAVYPVLLARLYQERGAWEQSLDYYRRALEIAPDDGTLRAEYAQTLFFAEDNRVTPRVLKQARRALELTPNEDTALGLLGIGAFQAGDYRRAIEHWQRALAHLPPGSPAVRSFQNGIASARQRLGGDADRAAGEAKAAESGTALRVSVSLGDSVQAPPDTPVFVYARAWQGSPMPLAIRRLTLADLPATVTLDETTAMSPAASLASADQVELVARVALSGSAAPAAGDFEARLGPIQPGQPDEPVRLTVDRQIP